MRKLIGLLLFIAISINSCGYKGDLYLPPKPQKVEKTEQSSKMPTIAKDNTVKQKTIASGAIGNKN